MSGGGAFVRGAFIRGLMSYTFRGTHRKQIARRHSCRHFLFRAGGVVNPVQIIPLIECDHHAQFDCSFSLARAYGT